MVQLLRCVMALLAMAVAPVWLFADEGKPREHTVAEYRDHLSVLGTLVTGCQQTTDAAHCSADAVGPDDRVVLPGQAGSRLVSYAWLRSVLEHAGDAKHPLTAAEIAPLLRAAAERLQLEQSQAPGGPVSATPAPGELAAARSTLSKVLARAEFRRSGPSLTERVLTAVAIWINRRLTGLAEFSSHRAWLGQVLIWGLVLSACTALALWFVQQTRRARGLNVGDAAPLDAAPALRHWERWRQEAETAAEQQRWRDAIRAFYWATIARLESRGQWPADSARTPREYLRLLKQDHPRHGELGQLTRSFEASWYGGGAATQSDCDAARGNFERLVAR